MELPDGLPAAPTGADCRRCTQPMSRTEQPDRYIDACSNCLIVDITLHSGNPYDWPHAAQERLRNALLAKDHHDYPDGPSGPA